MRYKLTNCILVGLLYMTLTIFCQADEIELTSEKKTLLNETKKSIEFGTDAQRYQWVSPVNLSLSHTQQRPESNSEFEGLNKATLSVNQDIFRSGGIYYTIKYANGKQSYDNLALEQKFQNYQKEAILSLLNILKLELQCEQNKYLVKNKEIAVILKRALYEVGSVDITELNDAIREKNTEQTNYLLLNESLVKEKQNLSKYTDQDINTLVLPKFALINEDDYCTSNYNVTLARQQNDVTYDSYQIKRSSYLPSIALTAQASYADYTNSSLTRQNGNAYSIGTVLNIPLDYNSFSSIEEKHALYLKQLAQTKDVLREETIGYQQSLQTIKRYEGVNKIQEENLALYRSIFVVTEKAFKAGYKSAYDQQTLQNSIKFAELEIQINDLNIQIELAKLHYTIKHSKG